MRTSNVSMLTDRGEAGNSFGTVTSDGAARPLVVRFGALGDQVILLALIEALHRRFHTPVDVVASGPWTRPLLEGHPAVGTLRLLRSRRTPYAVSPRQQDLVRELRARAPGPVWLCDKEEQVLAMLRRAGIADEWLLRADTDCPRRPDEHHVDRWLRFAQQSPTALPPMAPGEAAAIIRGVTSPPVRVLSAWRADVDAWLRKLGISGRPLVLIQAGNKRTMRRWVTHRRARNTKYWPEDRWATLARWLLPRYPDAVVLLLGVPVEAGINDEIARLAGSSRVLNVAREMTLPRLLALQEHALGMISVDTGPAHSAAALDCPLVVLFGKGNIHAYTPRSPSGAVEVLSGRDDGGANMCGISVQDVEDAWERLPLWATPKGQEHARSLIV